MTTESDIEKDDVLGVNAENSKVTEVICVRDYVCGSRNLCLPPRVPT